MGPCTLDKNRNVQGTLEASALQPPRAGLDNGLRVKELRKEGRENTKSV